MGGGYLNIIAMGNQNVYLNGNPDTSFFSVTYSKYTNFGLQKFRIDYDGLKTLRLNESSPFTFKIKRYADLLMDTYLVLTLPHVWSPIIPPAQYTDKWAPYEFRWIKNIGTEIIEKISVTCGASTLQEYTGKYIQAVVNRDFTQEKRALFNKMTGNVPELYDPANAETRTNQYPNAFFVNNALGAEPSIRGRKLYIPLNLWFTLNSRMAFPLCALQFNELTINITLRPLAELIQVRDVRDATNGYPYIKPDFNVNEFQMYRFLQTPPSIDTNNLEAYQDRRVMWNADIHLQATQCFLSDDEKRYFATTDHEYLIKEIYQYNFFNIQGAKRQELKSLGMVSSWVIYFQRNDVNMRNEWSNYTNWPYDFKPHDIISPIGELPVDDTTGQGFLFDVEDWVNHQYLPQQRRVGPGMNPDGSYTGHMITGTYTPENEKEILQTMAILFEGMYRETEMDAGLLKYTESYAKSRGQMDGMYYYNFCLSSDQHNINPTGAINMSKFKNIELEFSTYLPPIDPDAEFLIVCDPTTGQPVGTSKVSYKLYIYNYNMTVIEERYNILRFVSGNCALAFAR